MNNNNQYIKSCLNYTGGKYKLLPQIIPLFPENIDTFYDLFCGGCNVSINVNANRIIANDIMPQLIEFLNACKIYSSLEMTNMIHSLINEYSLSKENQEGYLKLREAYNNGNKNWDILYTLICYGFNNQIRFNKQGQFNMPFGKNRSSFNATLEQKFVTFVNHINKKNIKFISKDFVTLPISIIKKDDFVYADPPYSATIASYNENGGWNKNSDLELFEFLDKLNSGGIKFAMSNILRTEWLIDWSSKYNVHKLNYNYKNCNYQKKDKSGSEQEVLITNY